jgi:alkanesulfonate monooxygenase SsuD/methylene tetrahydromethanopterin reductase-like flavin-dependent oxidoreductase (luciferase family)
VDISVCLDPARTWPDLRELASAADERGMYAVYVPDHFLGYREAWTLLSAIAVSTERIRVGTLVLGVTHRHVAVLREMARTLDEVSGGRLLLGLGASWDEAEHRSLGLAFPPPAERLDMLESAAGQLANDGRSLLIGGAGERRTMPIAARYASAWHTWAEPDAFHNKCAVMDRLCGEAGREPAAVRRVTGAVLVDEDDPIAIVAAYRGAGVDEFVISDHRDVTVAESIAVWPQTR